MPEPFDGNSDCYLEVHGTVQSKTTVLCSAFFVFPSEDNLNVGEYKICLQNELRNVFQIIYYYYHLSSSLIANENYNEMLLVGNLLGDKKWSTGDGPTF